MRGRMWLATVAALGASLALPVSAGAQTPAHDSVQASGRSSALGAFTFSVQSGPSGENPSGTVNFFGDSGSVDCLHVSGNTAFVRFSIPLFTIPVAAKLIDGGPAGSGLDRIDAFFASGTSTNCGFQPFNEGPLTEGDVVVIDAPPLPTSKEQCKNGGWQGFGIFKNQGDCVSFVATGGRNQPAPPAGT